MKQAEPTTQSNTSNLVIRNIGELPVIPKGPLAGREQSKFERIESAAMHIVDGKIAWFGEEHDQPKPPKCEAVDAQGNCVIPGLIDCHTHTVFAGSRANEFVERIQGKSYTEIAQRGGGICVTVEAVRMATVEMLMALTLPRLRRMLTNGVTTVEIKSGYGLSVPDELKMLEVVRLMRIMQPIEVVGTYLAAHTFPREYADHHEKYLELICNEAVLRRLVDEKLAEFCDVFCEKTAFNLEHTRKMLMAAKNAGLKLKIHADQITQMGASKLAAEMGAISADHLEHIDSKGIAAMKKSGTIGVMLPGCSFFLGVEQAPARKLLEAAVPVAVATDYNPGSCMMESLPQVMNIACTQMRMTPAEVLVAATANAAAALGRQDIVGAIEIGMRADLAILDVSTVEQWMYEPGRNCISKVIKAGRVVHG